MKLFYYSTFLLGKMRKSNTSNTNEPRLGKTLKNDIHQVKMKEDLSGEYKDLKEYFLTDERKEKLKTMGNIRKFFIIPWWLLKSLYFKLTPFRRILLVIAIFLTLLSGNNKINSDNISIDLVSTAMIAGLIFLFILALELKDKLHAKTELEEGRAVQKALMPKVNPKVEGWDIWLYTKPANDVGGDLLDFLKLNEDKVYVSVGDVAGKGLSAALLMAKLQSTIRAIVPTHKSITELATKINRIFCRDSLPRLFASLIYLELKTNTGEIKLLNAGHLPPMLIHHNKVTQLAGSSPALGIIDEAIFNEQIIELKSQEYLFIYSDGLTETRNEFGSFYGDERLFTFLGKHSYHSSEELGKVVLSSVESFRGKAKTHDDITIAVIKRL